MDDTHRDEGGRDRAAEAEELEALAALEALDPADAPAAAELLADRLQAVLDESEESRP